MIRRRTRACPKPCGSAIAPASTSCSGTSPKISSRGGGCGSRGPRTCPSCCRSSRRRPPPPSAAAKDRRSRRVLRQQVAEALPQLLRLFAAQPAHAKRSSYQALERIFHEQCEVQEDRGTVQDKTGNTVMQNPSH